MSGGTVTCLCGAINFPLNENLPGESELCHCNPCRHTTGAFFAGWVPMLEKAPNAGTLSKCTVYASSKTHDRYFCSTCGTKAFIQQHHRSDGSVRDKWHAYGGAIDPPSGVDKVLDIHSHLWLADASDGGMAPLMTQLGGKSTPCYNKEEGSQELSSTALEGLIKNADSPLPLPPGETLKAQCRCGGVSLHIQQANHADRSISQLDRFIAKGSDGNPTNKHMAFCCVCSYCRKGSGVSLTPYMYIPPVQVLNAHTGKPVAQHHDVETPTGKEANEGLKLRHYWSSAKSCWSFCTVCGASAFHSSGSRLEIVNVAAGLLRAEEGPMARRWLSWQWGRTAWKDETTQKDVSDAWQATAHQKAIA